MHVTFESCTKLSTFCMQLLKFCTELLKDTCNFRLLHATFENCKQLLKFSWWEIWKCNFGFRSVTLSNWWPHIQESFFVSKIVSNIAILKFYSQLYQNYTQLSKLGNTYWWKLHAKSWKFRVKSKNLRATFQRCVYFSKCLVQVSKVACKKSKFTCNFQKLRAKSRKLHVNLVFWPIWHAIGAGDLG